MKVNNKVIVITGAGNGMGRAMTQEFIKRGAKVYGIDLNEAALKETKALVEKPANFEYQVLNITDRVAVAKLPAAVEKVFSAADILVNNAGIIQPFVKVNVLEFEAIDRVMNVNFNGPVNLVKAFLPGMLKKKAAQIANVSSMGG